MTSAPNKEQLAAKIASAILRIQERISLRLNRVRNLRLWLILFCLISAALSVFHLVNGITGRSGPAIRIERMRKPLPMPASPGNHYDERIPEEIYQSVQAYKHYMDSSGQPIRTGLADSIRLLEEMYQAQQTPSR